MLLCLAVPGFGQNTITYKANPDKNNPVEIAFTKTAKGQYDATYTFKNDFAPGVNTVFYFDTLVVKRTKNLKVNLLGFTSGWKDTLRLVNLSDQETQRPINFYVLKGSARVPAFYGVWKNPAPKGLALVSKPEVDAFLIIPEDSLIKASYLKQYAHTITVANTSNDTLLFDVLLQGAVVSSHQVSPNTKSFPVAVQVPVKASPSLDSGRVTTTVTLRNKKYPTSEAQIYYSIKWVKLKTLYV